MENQIIINEEIAKQFAQLSLENFEFRKKQIESKHMLSNHFNKMIIYTLFSMLKFHSEFVFATPHYEQSIISIIDMLSKRNFKFCNISDKTFNFNNIDMDKCVHNEYTIISIICNQIIELSDFYRIIDDEIDNFYKKKNDLQNSNPMYNTNGYYRNNLDNEPINYYAGQNQWLQYQSRPMMFTINPYVNHQQQQSQYIYDQIPLFDNDGNPSNEPAKALMKAIDNKIAVACKKTTRPNTHNRNTRVK